MSTPMMTPETMETIKEELESLYQESPTTFYCRNTMEEDNIINRLDKVWNYYARQGYPGYQELLKWWKPWKNNHIYEGDPYRGREYNWQTQNRHILDKEPRKGRTKKSSSPASTPSKSLF